MGLCPPKLYPLTDCLIWIDFEHGVFSVRSAQNLARDMLCCTLDVTQLSVFQKTLWSAKVIHRLKYFGWRMISQVFPTAEALNHRGTDMVNQCCFCGELNENLSHTIFSCRLAATVWDDLHCDVVIWWNRNFCFHEGICKSSTAIIFASLKMSTDIISFVPFVVSSSSTQPRQCLPNHGCVKVNFDAGFKSSLQVACLEAMARDTSGVITTKKMLNPERTSCFMLGYST